VGGVHPIAYDVTAQEQHEGLEKRSWLKGDEIYTAAKQANS
jgi:hypothetical protein